MIGTPRERGAGGRGAGERRGAPLDRRRARPARRPPPRATDLTCLRPGDGLGPGHEDELIGRALGRNVAHGDAAPRRT